MINKKIYLILVIIMSFLSSCIDYNINDPEVAVYKPSLTANTTISDLRNLFVEDKLVAIDDSVIILGTVIGNDKSNNLYKSIVIQDSTAGIQIDINSYGLHNKYHVGDLVYVKCKGLFIGNYGGQPKLGGEYEGGIGRIAYSFMDDYLFKSDGGKPIKPKELFLNLINGNYVSQLVVIKNAQFKRNYVANTFADADLNEDKDIYLEDCNGSTIIVRTSGYSDFARDLVPNGNGDVVALLTKYNDTYQLTLRDIDELNLDNERCGNFFSEDFEIFEDDDEINLYGWTSYSVFDPERYWFADTYSNNRYAKITGFNYDTFKAEKNEDWLITPPLDLTGFSSIQLRFLNKCNYSGPDLQVFISTNYDGTGNPNDFTWTELTGLTLSNGNYNEATSTSDISSYNISSSVYVGFKYTSSPSTGAKTWQIDNVAIIAE